MAYIVNEEMPKSCINECMFCSAGIPRNRGISEEERRETISSW